MMNRDWGSQWDQYRRMMKVRRTRDDSRLRDETAIIDDFILLSSARLAAVVLWSLCQAEWVTLLSEELILPVTSTLMLVPFCSSKCQSNSLLYHYHFITLHFIKFAQYWLLIGISKANCKSFTGVFGGGVIQNQPVRGFRALQISWR